jgi:hypothetical protein
VEAAFRDDDADVVTTINNAQTATAKEHSMSLWQGLKLYPKAIGWSILLPTAIVMEGYDVVLMGSFYAMDSFNKILRTEMASGLDRLNAVPTRVEPAVPAFPDEPETTGMADVAGPLYQRVVKLDHDERVGAVAVAGECHLD